MIVNCRDIYEESSAWKIVSMYHFRKHGERIALQIKVSESRKYREGHRKGSQSIVGKRHPDAVNQFIPAYLNAVTGWYHDLPT